MKIGQWIGILLVLQCMILIGQWTGSTGYVSTAGAQVPDAGAQRIQMIQELKDMNGKMDNLIRLLEGGNLQVKVAKSDESKGNPPGR
ncbi:MAG: hypothetical protein IT447_04235 [Phycisphaerales bacterium]|jgi:hypothetical protein|nr:hypothetical protein [Phycisphaerales bacterium]